MQWTCHMENYTHAAVKPPLWALEDGVGISLVYFRSVRHFCRPPARHFGCCYHCCSLRLSKRFVFLAFCISISAVFLSPLFLASFFSSSWLSFLQLRCWLSHAGPPSLCPTAPPIYFPFLPLCPFLWWFCWFCFSANRKLPWSKTVSRCPYRWEKTFKFLCRYLEKKKMETIVWL